MYGTVMERVILERHRHRLEEAQRRRRLDTEWGDERALRHHAPAFAFWRAVVALFRRS